MVERPFKRAIQPRDLSPTDKRRANHILGRVLGLEPAAVTAIEGRARNLRWSSQEPARHFRGACGHRQSRAIGNSSRNQARFGRRHQISASLVKRIPVDLRLLAFFARSLLGHPGNGQTEPFAADSTGLHIGTCGGSVMCRDCLVSGKFAQMCPSSHRGADVDLGRLRCVVTNADRWRSASSASVNIISGMASSL